MRTQGSLKIIALGALLAAPIAICIGFVHWCGVDVPYWDDWAFVKFYAAVKQGELGFSQILSVQHLDHRICVPFLLMLFISDLTKMNTVVIMYTTVFLSTLTALIFGWIIWEGTVESSSQEEKPESNLVARAMLVALPVVWLTLTLRQWEVFSWAFMIQTVLLTLFSTSTFCLLNREDRNSFALPGAILCAVLCSYTYLNGLLVWPIGLAFLIAKNWRSVERRRRLAVSSLIWCVSAAVVLAGYFYKYERWPVSMSAGDIVFDPGRVLIYFLACLANPLASEHFAAVSMGAILLLLVGSLVCFTLRKQIDVTSDQFFCIAICLFGLLTDGMIAIGRVGLGLHSAMYSRYSPLCMLAVIGLYLIVVRVRFANLHHRYFYIGAITSLMFVGVAGAFAEANFNGVVVRNARLVMANSLRYYALQNVQSMLDLHPTGRALEYARFLEARRLSTFSAPSVVPVSADAPNQDFYCRLEKINENQVSQPPNISTIDVPAQRVKALRIRGCVFDMNHREPAGSVSILVDELTEIPLAYGLTRTDIEESFGTSHLTNTGFEGACNLEVVGFGTHSLSLKVISVDRTHCHRTPVLVRINVQ